MKLRNIIVEGIDRLGKSTLIEGLQQKLGYFQVIHYEKPKLLKVYDDELVIGGSKSSALHRYQECSFTQMINMLSADVGRFILDRAHLGEYVYSPRYRKYDGSYVFDLEDTFIHYTGADFHESTLLVLLTTSDFSFIQDDGNSLDFSKKEEEQADFLTAFKRSSIKNKLLLDVSNGLGGFKPPGEILTCVIESFT